MHLRGDNATKARFLKGVLLAWVPFLLFMVPIFASAFRAISRQKANGLGAVAGGISEGLATFGLAALVISQILAIILLARTFERGHALRSLFSAISVCCSLLLISFMAVFVWVLIRFGR